MVSVLLTEVVERVGIITLNRPERRNALDGELVQALDGAVKRMAVDPAVKVVVLTGAAADGASGGFCSGGDVRSGRGSPGMELAVPPHALLGDLSRHEGHAAMLLHLMPKPSIAMVGGPAVGAGCSLAAACDLRIASEEAFFSVGFSPNGLSGDYGGSFLWTRIVGTARARQLYLLNPRVPAAQALEWGMVHAVVPGPELRAHTMETARGLVRTPAAVLALVKANLNEAEDDPDRRRWLFANEAVNQTESGRLTAEKLAQRETGPQPI